MTHEFVPQMAKWDPSYIETPHANFHKKYRKFEQNQRRPELGTLIDFKNDPDVIAIGCSFTASFELQEKYSWPRIIEKLCDASVNVCAFPGSSAMLQQYLLTDHIASYGKPAKIYALFPDLERLWAPWAPSRFGPPTKTLLWVPFLRAYVDPTKDDVHRWLQRKSNDGRSQKLRIATHTDSWGSRYLFPVELGLQQSLMGIGMMWRMCDAMGIEYSFLCWSERGHIALEKAGTPGLVKSYTPADDEIEWMRNHWAKALHEDNPGERVIPTCTRHSPQSDEQNQVWSSALDGWHPGLHHHLHYCESFLDRYITNDEICLLD